MDHAQTSRLLAEAVGFHTSGEIGKAERGYRAVLDALPHEPTALANLAVIAIARDQFAKALALAKRAIASNPRNPAAWSSRGIAMSRLGRHEGAVACYDQALRLAPDFAAVHANRAVALAELDRWDEALDSASTAVRHAGNAAHAHCALGLALRGTGRFEEALACYRRALTIAPDMIEAHQGRGVVLHRLGRLSEALEAFDAALARNQRFVEALSARGVVLQDLGRYPGAMADLDRALALAPDHADAHWNRALLKLLRGDYAGGWAEYEWRWQSRAQRRTRRDFAVPAWGGEDLSGKRILVHAEQGFGDTIQFCRYVRRFEAARVVLQVPRALVRLCATLGPEITVMAGEDAAPEVDVHCPLLSLPHRFGTTLATIPAEVPYLAVEAGAKAAWRSRVAASGRPRIGLAWAGRAANPNDHTRSVPCAALAPLLSLDADLHCLQRDIAPADRRWLEAHPALRVHDQALGDFTDTAALVEAMDLVITVDTAAAHLAGALAKPVWVMLAFAPDFRWLTARTDSPWYPTARLFRQSAPGRWDAVIAQVAAEARQREK